MENGKIKVLSPEKKKQKMENEIVQIINDQLQLDIA